VSAALVNSISLVGVEDLAELSSPTSGMQAFMIKIRTFSGRTLKFLDDSTKMNGAEILLLAEILILPEGCNARGGPRFPAVQGL
jgi:hypothetical protein